MNKKEFLSALASGLSALPQIEIDKTTAYYSELIDDRTDDGMTEEEAVASMGRLDEIIRNTMLDAPLATVIKSKNQSRRKLETWEIILLAVSIPFWFPIAISVVSTVLAVYCSIWAVIVGVWAALAAIVISAIVAIPLSFIIMGNTLYGGLFVLGISLVLIGLIIPSFYLVKFLTAMLVKLTVNFVRFIKNLILGKKTEKGENQ